MRNLLVVVKGDVFEEESMTDGHVGELGEVLGWGRYVSEHPRLGDLSRGDRMFLVTVRPGDNLWLVAVYEGIGRNRSGEWVAAKQNEAPVTDITPLAPKLRFTDRKPILMEAGKLAMSLQTPGFLTAESVALLERAIRVKGTGHL